MRVLFSCLPAYGHFHPLVPLARTLRSANHDVAFSSARAFCPQIERAGFEALPSGMSLPEQLERAQKTFPSEAALPLGFERYTRFVPKMLAAVAAPARLADLMGIVEKWRPDVLVHDEAELATPVAATVAGLPYADHSLGLMRPLAMARRAGEAISPLGREWGIDMGPLAGLYRYLYLDVCPASLQVPDIAHIAVAHQVRRGDGLDVNDVEQIPEWVHTLPDVPTVYVSLGTVFNRDARRFQRILDGLNEENVNIIVTVGPENDPGMLGAQPESVHVERYIPQSLVAPHVDVVVNSASSSSLTILAHGRPLLVLPHGADNFYNSEALVAAGVARQLLPSQSESDAVRREIRALLTEPCFQEAAGRLQAEIAAMPGPEEGVRLLEELGRCRRPIEGRPPPPAHALPVRVDGGNAR